MLKKKYDHAVVFLYATKNEHLLDSNFRKKIPYSTISGWRKNDPDSYIGQEYRFLFDDAFSIIKVKKEMLHLKKTLRTVLRCWLLLSDKLQPILRNKNDEKLLKIQMVEVINRLKKHMGIQYALRITGISPTLFQHWQLQLKFDCFDSFIALCMKHHPQQLNVNEVLKIKAKLGNTQFAHWPIISIASEALRNNEVVASHYSWYKYARIFGFKRKIWKKDRKRIGIVSTKPDQYWHADLTFYALVSGVKICIHIVMDNFSRMILGYCITETKTFYGTLEALKMAELKLSKKNCTENVILVTDGGSENHNQQVEKYLAGISGPRVTKVRALKEIIYSNSPVEAIHKILKGRYLPKNKFETIDELQKHLDWAVCDYNTIRPHYKHKPRTPHEVYFNIQLEFDYKQRINKALKDRLEINLNGKCTLCRCKGDKLKCDK